MPDHNFAKLLSKTQLAAAVTLDVPLCILAGAGTGKTRVITHRIAYLVERGAEPEKILGLTFTNKAAAEMRTRVEKLLPGISHRVQLGTFHGLAAKILRRYGSYVNVNSSFLIYNQDDSQSLLRQIAIDHLNIARDHIGFYAHQIDQWQNEGILPDEVQQSTSDLRLMKARQLYAFYWQQLQQVGALDFNGLLLKWRELLIHSEASRHLKAQFRHILVDEYQDTNVIQADIVHKLGFDADTIAIVGDDDQSIYSWRGAKPSNMQKFLDDLPNAKLIKLEENYRSTSTILRAANGVIAHNRQRLGKNLLAVSAMGIPVRLIRTLNDRSEADLIVHMIEDDLARGHSLSEFAVLMRTNGQSRPFEEALRRARLPYRLVGGIKFYDRKEVKDVLATLRAALNEKSDIDLYRAINAVPRGIGDASLKKAQEVTRRKNIPLMEVLLSRDYLSEAKINSKTVGKIIEFAQSLSELGAKISPENSPFEKPNRADLSVEIQGDLWLPAMVSTLPKASILLNAEQAVTLAIELSGVADRLSAEQTPEAQDRLDNINQLVSAAQQYVEDARLNGTSTDALSFLEATALLSSADDVSGQESVAGAMTLMTLHAAKGLEFDVIFMVGMEEYGFPHARALEEDADKNELEEERRLAYVGMTRAKKHLCLTYTQRRMIRGIVKGRMPSRFLRELPKDVISGDIPPSRYDQPESMAGEGIIVEFDPDFADIGEDAADLATGTRVRHSAFGLGTVLEKRGNGRMARALVRFDRDGKRRTVITKHLRVS